jgi:hypothetical protein
MMSDIYFPLYSDGILVSVNVPPPPPTPPLSSPHAAKVADTANPITAARAIMPNSFVRFFIKMLLPCGHAIYGDAA